MDQADSIQEQTQSTNSNDLIKSNSHNSFKTAQSLNISADSIAHNSTSAIAIQSQSNTDKSALELYSHISKSDIINSPGRSTTNLSITALEPERAIGANSSNINASETNFSQAVGTEETPVSVNVDVLAPEFVDQPLEGTIPLDRVNESLSSSQNSIIVECPNTVHEVTESGRTEQSNAQYSLYAAHDTSEPVDLADAHHESQNLADFGQTETAAATSFDLNLSSTDFHKESKYGEPGSTHGNTALPVGLKDEDSANILQDEHVFEASEAMHGRNPTEENEIDDYVNKELEKLESEAFALNSAELQAPGVPAGDNILTALSNSAIDDHESATNSNIESKEADRDYYESSIFDIAAKIIGKQGSEDYTKIDSVDLGTSMHAVNALSNQQDQEPLPKRLSETDLLWSFNNVYAESSASAFEIRNKVLLSNENIADNSDALYRSSLPNLEASLHNLDSNIKASQSIQSTDPVSLTAHDSKETDVKPVQAFIEIPQSSTHDEVNPVQESIETRQSSAQDKVKPNSLDLTDENYEEQLLETLEQTKSELMTQLEGYNVELDTIVVAQQQEVEKQKSIKYEQEKLQVTLATIEQSIKRFKRKSSTLSEKVSALIKSITNIEKGTIDLEKASQEKLLKRARALADKKKTYFKKCSVKLQEQEAIVVSEQAKLDQIVQIVPRAKAEIAAVESQVDALKKDVEKLQAAKLKKMQLREAYIKHKIEEEEKEHEKEMSVYRESFLLHPVQMPTVNGKDGKEASSRRHGGANNMMTISETVADLESLNLALVYTLDAPSRDLTRIPASRYASNVRNMLFAGNRIASIKGVHYLDKLRYLDISNNLFESIDLVDMTRLVFLNAAYNQLKTFSNSERAVSLRYLNVQGNAHFNLNCIKDLEQIHILGVGGNAKLRSEYQNVGPDGTSVDGSDSQTKTEAPEEDRASAAGGLAESSGLRVVSNLKRLIFLELNSNYLAWDGCLQVLAPCEYLQALFVNSNNFVNIPAPLYGKKALFELSMVRNKLREVSFKGLLLNLRVLKVDYNQINALSGFGNAPFISELYISSNNLVSLQQLMQLSVCQDLEALDLRQNNIVFDPDFHNYVAILFPRLRLLNNEPTLALRQKAGVSSFEFIRPLQKAAILKDTFSLLQTLLKQPTLIKLAHAKKFDSYEASSVEDTYNEYRKCYLKFWDEVKSSVGVVCPRSVQDSSLLTSSKTYQFLLDSYHTGFPPCMEKHEHYKMKKPDDFVHVLEHRLSYVMNAVRSHLRECNSLEKGSPWHPDFAVFAQMTRCYKELRLQIIVYAQACCRAYLQRKEYLKSQRAIRYIQTTYRLKLKRRKWHARYLALKERVASRIQLQAVLQMQSLFRKRRLEREREPDPDTKGLISEVDQLLDETDGDLAEMQEWVNNKSSEIFQGNSGDQAADNKTKTKPALSTASKSLFSDMKREETHEELDEADNGGQSKGEPAANTGNRDGRRRASMQSKAGQASSNATTLSPNLHGAKIPPHNPNYAVDEQLSPHGQNSMSTFASRGQNSTFTPSVAVYQRTGTASKVSISGHKQILHSKPKSMMQYETTVVNRLERVKQLMQQMGLDTSSLASMREFCKTQNNANSEADDKGLIDLTTVSLYFAKAGKQAPSKKLMDLLQEHNQLISILGNVRTVCSQEDLPLSDSESSQQFEDSSSSSADEANTENESFLQLKQLKIEGTFAQQLSKSIANAKREQLEKDKRIWYEQQELRNPVSQLHRFQQQLQDFVFKSKKESVYKIASSPSKELSAETDALDASIGSPPPQQGPPVSLETNPKSVEQNSNSKLEAHLPSRRGAKPGESEQKWPIVYQWGDLPKSQTISSFFDALDKKSKLQKHVEQLAQVKQVEAVRENGKHPGVQFLLCGQVAQKLRPIPVQPNLQHDDANRTEFLPAPPVLRLPPLFKKD